MNNFFNKQHSASIVPLVLLVAFGLITFRSSLLPKADVQPSASPTPIQAQVTLVTGTVTLTNGKPAKNIVVMLNNYGVTTDAKGAFTTTITGDGQQSLAFYSSDFKTQYQLTGTFEQSLFITKGQSQTVNWVIAEVSTK